MKQNKIKSAKISSNRSMIKKYVAINVIELNGR